MKKIILFDFNRTLYDPDAGRLAPGAPEVLREARDLGFTLALVSQLEMGRDDLVRDVGIHHFFADIQLCAAKTPELFREVFGRCGGHALGACVVVGDRIKKEIVCGNAVGAKTIWVRTGKFAAELAERPEEQPTFCVGNLHEVIPIIRRI